MLALWGQRPGAPPRDLLSTWRGWADNVSGAPVESGHFLAEEAPEETGRLLADFFAGSD
jgi:haloacetate dehalogenase